MPTVHLVAVNPIGSGYDPTASQDPLWMDTGSNFTLPVGRWHQASPNREDRNVDSTRQKGVTMVSNFDAHDEPGGEGVYFAANPGIRYLDAVKTQDIFNFFSSGTQQQVVDMSRGTGSDYVQYAYGYYNQWYWRNGPLNNTWALEAANRLSIDAAVIVLETMEGDFYMAETNPAWKVFVDRVAERLAALPPLPNGTPRLYSQNYFQRWYGGTKYELGQTTRQQHESLLNTEPASWPPNIFMGSGNFAATNLIVEDIYLTAPSETKNEILRRVFHMILAKKMGKHTGLFWFDVHEWSPGSAHNTITNGGVFERSDKIPHSPQVAFLLPFLAQEYGTVSIDWGLHRRGKLHGGNPRMITSSYTSPGKDRYYPGGGTSTATYPNYAVDGAGGYYTQLYFLGDFPNFGLRAWAQTCGQTIGGTEYYSKYRINGGSWMESLGYGMDEVRAFYEETYTVKLRVLGNFMSVFIYNFSGDNIKRTLEFPNPQDPNTLYSMQVCGIGPFSKLVNLNNLGNQ